MARLIYIYIFFHIFLNGIYLIKNNFCFAERSLNADTSFSVYTPWTDSNAVSTVLLEYPKDRKRAINTENHMGDDDQIMIRIRIGPSSNVGAVEKYLVINDVFDPKRQTKDRALVPYLVEVTRGEPVISYSLDYVKDVKYDNYKTHPVPHSKKSYQPITASRNTENEEKEYKPAMDRINDVMKQLHEILETDNQNVEHEDLAYQTDKDNEAEKGDIESDENDELVEEDQNIAKNEQTQSKLRVSEYAEPLEKRQGNDERSEGLCLKRRAFENWPKVNQENSLEQKIQLAINEPHKNVRAVISKALKSPNYQAVDSLRSRQMIRPRQAKRSNVQDLEKASSIQINDASSDLEPRPQINFQNAARLANKKRLRRLQRNRFENVPSQINQGNYKTENSKEFNEAASNFEVNEPLDMPQNVRAKRDVSETDAQAVEETNSASDQCDNIKMLPERDFDVQSCDTCGRKKEKTQKPPPSRLTQQKRSSNIETTKLRRQDENKPLKCQCRTHHSACICCGSKKSRSEESGPAWFSVFSLDSPTAFVASRIRIFRKRRGVWWEVAPPTHLNSITGVYSDGNYSFSFSSPIEFFQLEKALRLQDQQLLFPAKEETNELKSPEAIEENILNSKELIRNPEQLLTINKASLQKKSVPNLRPLTDFGFFPTTMHAIEKCPYNDKRMCLNVLRDEAPASTFKVQMPFQENVLVNKNVVRVQISDIIVDATTKDAMRLSVQVINKGVRSLQVSLNIKNCPPVADSSVTEAKTSVQKKLFPNIGVTATYLLPLIPQASAKHKTYECLVEVTTKKDRPARKVKNDDDGKVVAKRKFLVEPEKRCLCIWLCKCKCIPNLVSKSDYNMCKRMSIAERRQAGFPKGATAGGGDDDYADELTAKQIFLAFARNAAYLLLLMLLLGLIKAMLGIFSEPVNRCAFDYVYPHPNYDISTRVRRFICNVFLFAMLPFRFLCTCFTPVPEDLLVASSEWQCCKGQTPDCEDQFDDTGKLLQNHPSQRSSLSKGRLSSGIELKQKELSKRLSRLSLAFQQEISDDESKPSKKTPKTPLEIVRTLSEKRDLRRKSRHNLPSTSSAAAKEKLAADLVQSLLDAKRVYRIIKEPIGNVSQIPHGVKYCVQGYFIETLDKFFEFVSFQPLIQYRGISAETFKAHELHPPIFLNSSAFNRRYSNELAVLKSSDITLQPSANVPCINVRALNDEDDIISDLESSSEAASTQREIKRREQRYSASKTYQRLG